MRLSDGGMGYGLPTPADAHDRLLTGNDSKRRNHHRLPSIAFTSHGSFQEQGAQLAHWFGPVAADSAHHRPAAGKGPAARTRRKTRHPGQLGRPGTEAIGGGQQA